MIKLRKSAEIFEKIMSYIFTLCGLLAVIFVLVITLFLIISGIPAVCEIG